MEEELAAFCRREHPRLVRTLDLLCNSLPLAEDLAQETLARVCRDWDRVGKMQAPGAYAHRIAVNLSASTFRRRALEKRMRHRVAESDAALEADVASAVAIRSALAGLRFEQRAVLVLRYFHGYDIAEISEVLRMPVGTVKTHAHRGLRSLRGSLSDAAAVREDISLA